MPTEGSTGETQPGGGDVIAKEHGKGGWVYVLVLRIPCWFKRYGQRRPAKPLLKPVAKQDEAGG